MILPSITVKNGDVIKQDRDFNFDRVVKVTIYYGNRENGTLLALEYAPLKDERLCARIEATINDIVIPKRQNGRPGFTAEITLYNVGSEVDTALARHTQFIQDFTHDVNTWQKDIENDVNVGESKALKRYYDSKPRVRIDCGYWNHEGKFADYGSSPIFEGYINNSLNYLKGNDQITKLYCHDFDAGQISSKAIVESLGGKYTKEDKEKFYLLTEDDKLHRSGEYAAGWTAMAARLVRFWHPDKPNPGYENSAVANAVNTLGLQKTFAPTASGDIQLPRLPVTEADRERQDWFRIIYLKTPADKDSRDPKLAARLSRIDMRQFYTHGAFINDMLNDLCNYKDADVAWMVDYNYEKGAVVYFIYPTGQWSQYTKGSNAEIKIVNFQNLINLPTVGADGSLNIKMFLNKSCIPPVRLALILDESIGGEFDDLTTKAGIGLRDWLAPAGKISSYAGFNIYGARTSALYAIQHAKQVATGNGYMFNIGFPIINAKHEISTHGNAWFTTVKTIPAQAGINFKSEKKE